MSHYVALVIGENPEEQLRGFHEFECTGIDDEFVQDVDITAETRTEYGQHTTMMLRDQGGNLCPAYEDRFYRDPTPEEREKIGPIAGTGWGHDMSWTSKSWGDGRGYQTKVHYVPEGLEEVQVPTQRLKTFAEFAQYWTDRTPLRSGESPDLSGPHKYGYLRADEAGEVICIIKRTNPQAKWDYYVLGGRWRGFLRLKSGLQADQALKGNTDLEQTPTPHAVVIQGRWYERGDMGWWGCIHDAKDEAAWRREFTALVNALPADTLLSAFDCHI